MAPKFSLQTVLDVRHSKVESLEIELGKLLQVQRQTEVHLQELQTWQAHLQGELQEKLSGVLDLVAVHYLRENLEMIRKGILQTLESLEAIHQQVEAKRQELVAARQSEETLGILKRKEQEQYLVRLAEQESRQVDDLYISRSYRQHR